MVSAACVGPTNNAENLTGVTFRVCGRLSQLAEVCNCPEWSDRGGGGGAGEGGLFGSSSSSCAKDFPSQCAALSHDVSVRLI